MGFAGDWAGFLNGLAFGAGSPYSLTAITGWHDMNQAPVAGSLAAKQTQNGSWEVQQFMPTRVVTMVLQINSTSGPLEAAIDALAAATQPALGEIQLGLHMGGVYTTIKGTVTARTIPTTLDYLAGYTAAQIQVECTDPRRFGNTVFGSLRLPLSSGGLTFPAQFPVTFPSTVIRGATTLNNPGNTPGKLFMTVTGPITGPMLTHTQSGLSLSFAPTFDVASGDTLVIDFDARTALANGQASRAGSITTRGWLPFAPGDNTYSLAAASYNAFASVVITALPAWI